MMEEASEDQDFLPILKSIRHEFVGFSKIGNVTIRERQIPKSYALKFLNTPCDKKQFYLNSSKGKFGSSETSKLRSLQILRRAKIRKPVKTTGESDAKIRMPPPKFPPPWFIKKKSENDEKPSGAMLKPTLQPVETRTDPEKNDLNFVPFELPKYKTRTLSPTHVNNTVPLVQTDNLSETSKPHEKVGRISKIVSSKRRKHKIVKKLKPIFKAGDSKPIISEIRMRKLVDLWATKLGSMTNNSQKRSKPVQYETSKTPKEQTSNDRVNLTNNDQNVSDDPTCTKNKPLGKQNPYTFSYRYQKPHEMSDRTSSSSAHNCTTPTPMKMYVESNPLVNQTIELLRFKRDVEAKIESFETESVVGKMAPLPVIIKPPKGELTLETIPITNEEVNNVLMKRLAVLLAHEGFTHTKLPPMELLADCLNNFLRKMSSRLKQVTERELAGVDHGFPDPMERTLVELGMGGVRGLEDFYQTKVVGYHRRMVDQCSYLRKQYASMFHAKIAFSPATPLVNPDSQCSVVLDSSYTVDETMLAVPNSGLPNTSPL